MEYSQMHPAAGPAVLGVKSGTLADLKSVAQYQRIVQICAAVYLISMIAGRFMLPSLPILSAFIALGAAITLLVFVILLSSKIYSTEVTVLLGILCLLPLINLLVVLIVNSQASSVLRRNGIDVGFMGASEDQIG